jgi:hypothetical protein
VKPDVDYDQIAKPYWSKGNRQVEPVALENIPCPVRKRLFQIEVRQIAQFA